MNIRFYIPKDQIIPTNLRLKADNVDVFYERLGDGLGYEFEVFTTDTDLAKNIVDTIADLMCSQSYDHGAEWRVTYTKMIPQDYSIVVQVRFRVRDAG